MSVRSTYRVLMLAGLWAPSTVEAQDGMALTPPRPPVAAVERSEPSMRNTARPTQGETPLPAGRLPDQATGRKRTHVVRDICIGC